MNFYNLQKRFNEISSMGFVKSHREHNTGIGKTFEDLLGVEENNLQEGDFEGIEVKTSRFLSNSRVTLFTKTPAPKGSIQNILSTFGYQNNDHPHLKQLHASFFANRWASVKGLFEIRLNINSSSNQLECLFRKNGMITQMACWDLKQLEQSLNSKLKALVVVDADSKIENGHEYFHFTSFQAYQHPSMNKFLNLIEKGDIGVDFRIGSYKSGPKLGQAHDHGTGFRIAKSNITKLYEDHVSSTNRNTQLF